jgi:predicted aspartyl protease
LQGRDAGWFVFDTGAGSTAVDTRVVEKLGLSPIGNLSIGGVGGVVDGTIFRAGSLTIGPVTLDQPVLVGSDFSEISELLGVRIGGIVGYDVFSRTVVVFDRPRGSIRLRDPATFDRPGIDWQRVSLYNRVANVHAVVEGHEGVFTLDTGAGGSLVLHVPAVRRLGLLEGRATNKTTVHGVGGALPALQGTTEWFELAGHRMTHIRTKFATQPKGAFGDPYTLGNIGGGILDRFTLVLDFSNRRIAFFEK